MSNTFRARANLIVPVRHARLSSHRTTHDKCPSRHAVQNEQSADRPFRGNT